MPQLQIEMVHIAAQNTPVVRPAGALGQLRQRAGMATVLIHGKAPWEQNAIVLTARLFFERPTYIVRRPTQDEPAVR